MDRRRLLACFGGCLTTAAGCLSTVAEQSENNTTVQPNSNTTDPASDTGPSLSAIVVRKSVTYLPALGSSGVLTEPDRQYLVASIQGAQSRDERFVFETDEQSWEAGVQTYGHPKESIAGHRRPFVAFDLPSPLSVSNPRIRFTGDEATTWPIPASHRDTLSAPAPRFELTDLTVPETIFQGDQMSVSLTVKNVSETTGTFLGTVHWPTKRIADDDETRLVRRTIEAGDTLTEAVSVYTPATRETDETVSLSLGGHVTAQREVAVVVEDQEN